MTTTPRDQSAPLVSTTHRTSADSGSLLRAVVAASTESRDDAIAALVDRLEGAGIGELFAELVAAARAAGDRVLFHAADGTDTTGREFAQRLAGMPAALYDLGMRTGDVALVGVRPGVDAIIFVLASMRVGVVTTVIDPGAGLELFNRRIELMRPQWVVAESLLYAASMRSPLRPALRTRGFELPRLGAIDARHVRVGRWLPGAPRGATTWSDLLDAARGWDDCDHVPVPDDDSTAIVFFTSGTTGHPKGVQHTGASTTGSMRFMVQQFDLPADGVFYNHNLHSFVVGVLLGVRTVIAHLKMDPARWQCEADEAQATHAFLRPVDAFRLVQHCERTGTPFPQSLRQVFLYSAPITKTILERMHAVAHPDLVVTSAYAMTEAAPVAWVDSRVRMAWSGDGDLVGPPCPGMDVRVDERGELHIRGANVHRGYAGMEDAEWHATGDLARIEADGSIVLLGRAKDMLIRGSFNLYPGLYEDTISSIAGVNACAFVGVPDAETADEVVVLYVEPEPDLDAGSRAKLATRVERGLRAGSTRIDVQALPDLVLVVDALPRAGRASKIDRATLRERAADAIEAGTGRG